MRLIHNNQYAICFLVKVTKLTCDTCIRSSEHKQKYKVLFVELLVTIVHLKSLFYDQIHFLFILIWFKIENKTILYNKCLSQSYFRSGECLW